MKPKRRGLRVLCLLPTPPPFAGPEVASQALLLGLAQQGEVFHVRTNVKSSNRDKGNVDFRSIARLMWQCFRQVWLNIAKRPHVTYTLLSQNRTGLLRDAAFVLIARVFRQPTVLHFRGSGFSIFAHSEKPYIRWLVARVVGSARLLITQGEAIAPQFCEWLPAEKIVVLPNGIDASVFADKSRTKEEAGVSVRVLFLGHLSKAKGYPDFVTAADLVYESDPSVRFVAAGERLLQERNILPPDVVTSSSLGLSETSSHIEEIGVVSGFEKTELLTNTDILVLPSYSEGFPMSILEAMAARTVIIATPVGAISEILDQGKCGRIVPIGAPKAIATAILELVERPDVRHELAEAAVEKARNYYDLSKVTNDLLTYLEVAGGVIQPSDHA